MIEGPVPDAPRSANPTPLRIVDAVFARPTRATSRAAFAALGVAVAIHVIFWSWARLREPSLEEWSAALAARIHIELSRRDIVELLPPQAKDSPAQAAQPSPSRGSPDRKHEAASARLKSPPAPARAGHLVTQEPRPTAPIDLTHDTFVTGSASAYAGGTTAARGTNQSSVSTTEVDLAAKPTINPGEPNRARGVTLDNDEWRCPWPAQADAEQIDEQSVVLRVKVRADGTAASARLVADPGHGFGPAAIACAMKTRFVAARDRTGSPTDAESPPIRLRFTR